MYLLVFVCVSSLFDHLQLNDDDDEDAAVDDHDECHEGDSVIFALRMI